MRRSSGFQGMHLYLEIQSINERLTANTPSCFTSRALQWSSAVLQPARQHAKASTRPLKTALPQAEAKDMRWCPLCYSPSHATVHPASSRCLSPDPPVYRIHLYHDYHAAKNNLGRHTANLPSAA
jgi:hypothetical protein